MIRLPRTPTRTATLLPYTPLCRSGLLVNCGGHPMAAGLTVAADRLAELAAFLDARFARRLAEIDYRPALGIDGALRPRGASLELLAQLERCGPFGVGNVQPKGDRKSTRLNSSH